MPHQWIESTSISIYKNRDKTNYSGYGVKSLLKTTYKMLSNINLVLKLTPYVGQIIGDYQ
jgi:hypothetical protein